VLRNTDFVALSPRALFAMPCRATSLAVLATASVVFSLATSPPAGAQAAVADAPAAKEAAASSDTAAREQPGTLFMRYAADESGDPIGMQTAVVRYKGRVGDNEVVVDLIGAVHVGDAAYYNRLNDLFEQYDTLLYELVAPKGTVIPRGEKASSRHALGAMQNGMKDMLALEHQLEKIDYTKPNFVHADMSPEEFMESMKSRDESFLKLYFRVVGESIAHQSNASRKGDTGELDMFKALLARPADRSRQLKIAMAKQMSTFGDMFDGLGGEQGTAIINGRNEAAFKVLREQLDAGRRKVGVFYGAGHLADMDKRLKTDFGLQPVSVSWLTAWDLSK
jgi:hypothetical protein